MSTEDTRGLCNFCRRPADEAMDLVKANAVSICGGCVKTAYKRVFGERFVSFGYLHRGDVEEGLDVQFEDHPAYTPELRREIAESIANRIKRDDVLEPMAEAVQARMIELFYRELATRMEQLVALGLPVERAVTDLRNEFERPMPGSAS